MVKYEILEKYGVIGKRKEGDLELRLVAWNEKEPQYDIRPWYIDEDGQEKYLKGLVLSKEEFQNLKTIIGGIK